MISKSGTQEVSKMKKQYAMPDHTGADFRFLFQINPKIET
jgi:hypothetical protein